MRALLPCLLATATLAAGGLSYDPDPEPSGATATLPRAYVETDADQVEIYVRISVTAPTRSAADTRMREISAKLTTRFEDREGLELSRREHSFARPKGERGLKSTFLGKSDSDSESFTATSTWALRSAINDDATSAVESLRAETNDLLKPDAAKEGLETLRMSEATFRLSNPEDYRVGILHRIREDAADAARHLPEGENRLELPSLEQRVQVTHLSSTHLALWLPYTLRHKSQVTPDEGQCGCEEPEPADGPSEEHDHSK
jgi:hypothetical protein